MSVGVLGRRRMECGGERALVVAEGRGLEGRGGAGERDLEYDVPGVRGVRGV